MLSDNRCAAAWSFIWKEIRHAAATAADRLPLISASAAVFVLLCTGCAFWNIVPVEVPQSEITCRTGNVTRDIRMLASSITGLNARARVQVTAMGKKYPSVSCTLKWSHAADNQRMRITGSGPFGITVFDALLRDNYFFLYIPSHDVVYAADLHEATVGNDIRAAAGQVRMALNPWSVLEETGYTKVRCSSLVSFRHLPQDAVCYAWPHSMRSGVAVFRKTTLSPVMQDTDACTLKFSGLLEETENNPFCLTYPSRITIRLKFRDLIIDIKVREAVFNRITHDHQAFNSAGFISMPLRPIRKFIN